MASSSEQPLVHKPHHHTSSICYHILHQTSVYPYLRTSPHYTVQVSISDQRKRMAEVESTAISHRAEAASLFRQAESAKQEASSVRQELAGSRDSHRAAEAELRGEVIGLRAEADATIEALRMQLTAVTSKLKRLVAQLTWHTTTDHD